MKAKNKDQCLVFWITGLPGSGKSSISKNIFNDIKSKHIIPKMQINRKYLKNYLEIYIKADSKILFKRKQKYFYRIKTNNVWGIDIKPEFPKKADIVINNNFKKNTQQLANSLLKKIKKKFK